jgi:predicted methyltransferase
MKPHIDSAKALWKEILKEDSLVVDATCGNGHDTLYLASLVPKGHVYSYDIQSQPILSMTEKKGTLPITLFNKSHVDFSDLPQNITLFVYNLGYLPGGDKTITTKTHTSLESVQKALHLLSPKGLISVTCYPGHEEGKKESEALVQWSQTLHPQKYLVEQRVSLNRLNAPFLLLIKPLI